MTAEATGSPPWLHEGHGRVICSHCGSVVAQCRCVGTKPTSYQDGCEQCPVPLDQDVAAALANEIVGVLGALGALVLHCRRAEGEQATRAVPFLVTAEESIHSALDVLAGRA